MTQLILLKSVLSGSALVGKPLTVKMVETAPLRPNKAAHQAPLSAPARAHALCAEQKPFVPTPERASTTPTPGSATATPRQRHRMAQESSDRARPGSGTGLSCCYATTYVQFPVGQAGTPCMAPGVGTLITIAGNNGKWSALCVRNLAGRSKPVQLADSRILTPVSRDMHMIHVVQRRRTTILHHLRRDMRVIQIT